MKNIAKILFVASLVILGSCSREEDNLFEKGASQRMDEAIENTINILTDAANGWKMQYYPSSTQAYGGYNFFLKFGKDGVVSVNTELATLGSKNAESYYKVNQSNGVTLCFDTYNDYFHLFADPSPVLGGSTGVGLEGENDFLIISADSDKIVLKGKKTGTYSTMVPAASDDWNGLIKELQDAEEEMMSYTKYFLYKGETQIPMSISTRNITFSCTDEEGGAYTVKSGFILNPTGIKMYEPIDVMGASLDEFEYDSKSFQFKSTADPSIRIVPYIPPLSEVLATGNWSILYSGLGAYGKALFDATDANLLDSEGEELVYACLCYGDAASSSYKHNWGFFFISGQYAGIIGLDATAVADDKVSLIYNKTNEGNGDWYLSNAKFNQYIDVFGYSMPRTFTITTDNIKKPSWLLLTEDGNPDNTVKLVAGFEGYKHELK